VKALFFIPIVLSLLVLGAHFLRYDNAAGVIMPVLLIGLLFVRKAWVARVVQVGLLLGTVEWAHTLYRLVQVRVALDEPYTRLVIILGTVMAITALSALLFQAGPMRRIYGLSRND
jgi:hypothetical protein